MANYAYHLLTENNIKIIYRNSNPKLLRFTVCCLIFGSFLLFYKLPFIGPINENSINEDNYTQLKFVNTNSVHSIDNNSIQVLNNTGKLTDFYSTTESLIISNETLLQNLSNIVLSTTKSSKIDVNSTTTTTTTTTTSIPPMHNNSITSKVYNNKTESTTVYPTTQIVIYNNETLLKNVSQVFNSTPKIKIMTIPSSEPNQFAKYLSNYHVYTHNCRIPRSDPFTSELKKIYTPFIPPKCHNDKPLTSVLFNSTTRQYTLHINTNVLAELNTTLDKIKCCYMDIVRSGTGAKADDKYKLLPCSIFHQDFNVPQHVNAIIVECSSETHKKLTYKNAYSFIQYKSVSNQTTEVPNEVNNSRKPNVLLIGIDTLSRINIRRTMIETFEYLTSNNWIELEGYNKVGDNTFPNLLPLLAGISGSTCFKLYNPVKIGGIDKAPFIWKDFKRNGYRTAYAEDSPGLSTFNYIKKGFEKPPTDYYLRPMALAINRELRTKLEHGIEYCVGHRQAGEYIYDYAVELTTQYKTEPVFGLFWTNSFSHQDFTLPRGMDQRMVEYFETFKANGVLDTSIIFFFSDHGVRWGTLLKMPEGFLEERLPMFFIWLPLWFRTKHPEMVKALEINRNRLTSPFDIYMTLQHILKLSNQTEKSVNTSGCPKSQSLFSEISENRTCDDACIPEHWCTCQPYDNISKKNETVIKITKMIINEMNNYLIAKNLTKLCSKLSLQKILDAKIQLRYEEISLHDKYRIKFETKPKQPFFEATVVYKKSSETIEVDVDDISRLTSYEKDAKCTDNKKAKKYCICKR